MLSIWWIERLCERIAMPSLSCYCYFTLSVTLTQLDCIMGNTPYGRTKTKTKTKLLRDSGYCSFWPTFKDALCGFNVKMEIDLLSNPSEIAA
ncbi:hypothetical protein Tco_0835407 [Tanacetum coccineum]